MPKREKYPDKYHLHDDEETLCNRGSSFTNNLPTLCGLASTEDMQISRNVKFSPTHWIGISHPDSAFTRRETISRRGQDLTRSARPYRVIPRMVNFICSARIASVLSLGQDFDGS